MILIKVPVTPRTLLKVAELRDLVKEYKKEELQSLVVEVYKAIPKKVKEANDIDEIIKDIKQYKEKGKVKKQEKQVNFHELKHDIELFVDYAYKQYYFAPNSFVRKNERPKWRFMVKRFFKELQMITPADKGEEEAVVNLMKSLYEMLCYGCGYYIFNTDDPFRSVGIGQTEAYDAVITRKFSSGKNPESIRFAIELIMNNNVDFETVHSDLIIELMKHLNIADLKMTVIDQCQLLRKKTEKVGSPDEKKGRSSSTTDYKLQEKIKHLDEMIFRCYIGLAEYDEAIKYFNKTYPEKSDEIKLYVLLRLLFGYNLKDLWIEEFERAVSKKVKPRDSLQRMHAYIKHHNAFPKYMY